MPALELMAEIRRVAGRVPGVMAVEKCFARNTGLQYHVDLHLEVDSTDASGAFARDRDCGQVQDPTATEMGCGRAGLR